MKEALLRAIKEAGGFSALAARLKSIVGADSTINYRHIQQWRDVGRVPAEWVLHVERAVSGAVTRYELRPDVFGEAPKRRAKVAA